MVRFLSNAKNFSVLIADKLSNAIVRRGYAASTAKANQGSVSSGLNASTAGLKKKRGEELTEKAPWVPDPKTGYYRPETRYDEIDPAELRAALLNNKQ